jgi:hypothetical protein
VFKKPIHGIQEMMMVRDGAADCVETTITQPTIDPMRGINICIPI